MGDGARGLSSRYLSEQAIPQARWQSPDVILDRRALAYDPDNPGRKILVGAYAHEHITHYTREEVARRLRAAGYGILDCRYVGFCEMIFKARKPLTSGPRPA